MQLFARLTKIDEAKRLVYGRAAQEVPDHVDEILDYEKSKPYFQAWNESVSKATDGKSLGSLRVMHQPIVAGRLTDVIFNDAEKAVDVVAHVVDDAEWDKVQLGCYTGFSIGGKYLPGSRVVEKSGDKQVTRYVGVPHELSLVDVPCIPTAQFTMVKADGGEELRKFDARVATASPQGSDAAGEGTSDTSPTSEVEPPAAADAEKAAVDEIAKAIDDGKLKPSEVLALMSAEIAKRDAAAKAEGLVELRKALSRDDLTNREVEDLALKFLGAENASGTPADMLEKLGAMLPAEDVPGADVTTIGDADAHDPVRKGLWDIGRLADAVSCIDMLCSDATWEAAWEGDNSPIPARLKAVRDELAMILVEMADEETRELTEAQKALRETTLEKVGARHAKKDLERLQSIHDHSVGMGAACTTEAAKVAPTDALCKLLGTDAEHVDAALAAVLEKARKWDDAPAVPKGKLRAIARTNDASEDAEPTSAEKAREDEIKRAVDSGDPLALMKVVQKYGAMPGAGGPAAPRRA